jgi:Porin PorA
MRRVLGYVAFTVGCALIFLSPLMAFYVKPRVEKAPTDVNSTDVSDGTGEIFRASSLKVEGPLQIQNISLSQGNPEASTETVAVINRSGRTVDSANGDPIDWSYQVYAMDRSTGAAVDCCGAAPPAEGYTLKLPFHLQQQEYSFYNDTLGKAFPMIFDREESLEGMDVYVFTQKIPKTYLEAFPFPGALAGQPGSSVTTIRYYEATTTIWVEPLTGAIVKGSQQAHQWVEYGGKVVTDLATTDLTNTPATVTKNMERVNDKLSQLRVVEALPIWGLVIGLVLLAVGLVLLLWRRGGAGADDSP